MTELVKHATERSNDATCAVSLLRHYGFDLGGHTLSQLILDWQEHYPAAWLRLATIEALYQGRYKAISVEQILAMWQRRSQPIYHFNREFEHLVCDKLPDDQVSPAPSPPNELLAPRSLTLKAKLPYHSVALQLPSFEATALPESDVMLALRTLHSAEMAVLTEGALTESALIEGALTEAQMTEAPSPTEAPNPTEANEQAPKQTYSYKLRSDEQPCGTSSYKPDQAPVQNAEQKPPREDAKDSEVSDAALQDELTVPLHQPKHEQPLDANQSANKSVVLALPLAAQTQTPLPQVGSIAKILQQLDHQELNATAAIPGFGLLSSMPKPSPQIHLAALYQPIWLTDASSKQPIHQFTPVPALPDFYSKLKAIAQPPKEPEDEAPN